MKPALLLVITSLCSLAFASDPPVWNRPTSNITVGSAAYYDCQTPSSFNGTAAYMKLWVNGNAVALNHNLNRLGAVIWMASGSYPVVCQYSIDGTNGISSSTLTITYSDGDSSLEYLDLQNSEWTPDGSACSGSCGAIGDALDTVDSNAGDTYDGKGTSGQFSGTEDNKYDYEDEYWYQKRVVNFSLPDAWIYDFWLRQSSTDSVDLPRGLEFGISQCYSGSSYIKYRMAFQASYSVSPAIWNVWSPTASDPNGSAGSWTATTLQVPDFTNPDTDPNNGFTHVFFVGHPSTDGVHVVIDAIQIGDASGASPGNAAQIVNMTVPAYTDATANCSSSSGQFNLQSAQLDLDEYTYLNDIFWMDDVSFHFQP